MILLSRILLLLTFALFWGGLTFYTGFVVRISHDVVSDSMEGGLITQRVTVVLQYLALACLALMTVNGIVVRRRETKFGNALLFCTSVAALAVLELFVVHDRLDQVIDTEQQIVTDDETFANGHRHYNQGTTIEWLATLFYLPITVFAWKRIDSGTPGDASAEPSATSPV